ncbi:hypothetical protein BC826DRAFT_1104496 [Russula brevipes]|nr:hypothetical protein BC826DRAFT_1104496 [Russula brevipes]
MIHLAAIKLLEGIGAISKAEGKKAAMRGSNYQDTIATPLSSEHDHNTTDDNEIDDITADLDMDTDVADGVLPAIEKVGITLFVPIELNHNLTV